jgi:hypothetical protein
VMSTDLDTHLVAETGYLVVGWTPDGHYGAAADASPLEDGRELTVRLEGLHARPPAGATDFSGNLLDAGPINWYSGTVAYHWEVSRNLRLQWDVAYELARKAEIFGGTHQNYQRLYLQFWSTFRL